MVENIWVSILGIVFGGGMFAILEMIRDWRHKKEENKLDEQKSETENEVAEVDLQSKTLQLINDYIDSVKTNSEKMLSMNSETHKKLDNIERNQKEMHKRIKLIETFLNGEFKRFREENENGNN